MKIANAFSLNMLDIVDYMNLRIEKVDPVAFIQQNQGPIENFIGHPDTDRVVRDSLARWVAIPEGKRGNLKLLHGESLLIAQYIGPRLPEGATTLPEGATIDWFAVKIQ